MNSDHLPRRELEKLSAYLDGELNQRQAQKVEARLQAEPRLRKALRELQAINESLRALPQVKPPRSFILSPDTVDMPQRKGRYPILRLATALAAFAFVALVGVDVFSNTMSGAMPARSFDQAVAEAPAVAERELADAAKSEVVELDAEMEEAPADMLAGAEVPAEEAAGEGLALAEPAAEEEDAAVEERILGESEAPAEPQAAIPEMTVPVEDEARLAYSATAPPDLDAMANQVEQAEPMAVETFEQSESGPSTPVFWIRGIEIGLAALTLVLGTLTLWARKQHR